ncbi:hypothetical protein [Rhizobium redzepovicii]
MRKIKVKLHHKQEIFVHNNLANTAFYLRERISDRLVKDDREGIGLEMTACLVMIAFAMEAHVNFFGWRLAPPKWDERDQIKAKIKVVAKHIGLKADFGKRPYKTVKDLKALRDQLAHGKPEIITRKEDELITTHEELEALPFPQASWEKYLTKDFVDEAFDDMNSIWNEILAASGLEVFDAITKGDRSIQYIGEA